MSLFSEATYEKAKEIEAKAEGGDYVPFAKDTYTTTIMDVEVQEREEKVWEGGVPTPTGNMEDIVVVTLSMDAPIAGGEVLDINGDEAKFNTTKLWLSPVRLGIGPQGPSIARKFVGACLNMKLEDQISITDFEKVVLDESTKGKQLKVVFGDHFNKKSGKMGTKIVDIMPVTSAKEEVPKA